MSESSGMSEEAGEEVGTSGLIFNEPLIFEMGSPGRTGFSLEELEMSDFPLSELLPEGMVRGEIEGMPELSEVEVIRHFTRLSQWNFAIDLGFYPLGSCTMKYNPKVNEEAANMPGFSRLHPLEPDGCCQGALSLIWHLERCLCEIGGMDRVSLQPAAGAHGELVGLMMIRAYHASRGNPRKKVLLPDSSHGTNPASATLCGYSAVQIASNHTGCIDVEVVRKEMDEDVAALMITNPNTLGLFEENIVEVAELVHSRGGLVYCDGANLNALMGIARPGDMGVDVLHFNLHKTFSTPHGGGGPGAGPVGVKSELVPFLPVPVVEREGDEYRLRFDLPQSIGRVRAFHGNFGIIVRAYSYVRSMGAEGLERASRVAVINANYIRAMLRDAFHVPFDRPCMHECVISDKLQRDKGVETLHIAKRLIDLGFHPPTVYFPLIVKGAMLIEPTETESKETLDSFIAAMKRIAREAEEDPQLVRDAPSRTLVVRLDEVMAARRQVLRWEKKG